MTAWFKKNKTKQAVFM